MTRKALLVAVGDYGEYAERLTAPAYEIEQWRDLLSKSPYNFEIMPPLIDGEATRDAVLKGLRDLLSGAKQNDQLLLVFAGHGNLSEGRNREEGEQSLVASPLVSGLKDAAIRESDVQEIFDEIRPPRGTDITFVLECCHSADYGPLVRLRSLTDGFGIAATAIPLAAPPTMDVKNIHSLRTFGEFAERESSYEKPVILAATGKYDLAYEVTYDGIRRMLFSLRLLWWLRQTRDTFLGIRTNINPLHPDFPQEARLGGNASRWSEKFPGEPSGGDQLVKPTQEIETASVNLRVLGLATFVNARGSVPYKARIILPFDEGQYVPSKDRHFACIEIATDDMIGTPSGPLASKWTKRYTKAGVEYTRWSLNGYTVTIQTGNPDRPFYRRPDFENYVPKLTVIAPELEFIDPHPLCFDPAPLLNRLAAFVNLPGGSADVGPPQTEDTIYVRRYSGAKTYGPVRTRRSVKVNIPIVSEYATIVLRPYLDPTQEHLVVNLKPGATILIANAREADITGDGEGDIPREQFLLYYKLAPSPLPDPPLPVVTGIPIDDCTVTDWP
jgi:hypothetical protein